ncbi:hypothetical protein [Amycolatopsis pigmentata]|uniref:Uncharacterized protein n=1 Tax=Amycolatopsis pigmentata TaxID=450801 RepID=A0ABW5FQA7_9PSEU
MNFDSHASVAVSAAVGAINLLTPGHALGREYPAEGPDDELREPLRPRQTKNSPKVSEKDVDRLREYAIHLREVFVAVDTGRIDDACAEISFAIRRAHSFVHCGSCIP